MEAERQRSAGTWSTQDELRMSYPTAQEMADYNAREAAKSRPSAVREGGMEWEEVAALIKLHLPETAPPLPYEMSEEGKRLARFRQLCPPEFMSKIDRSLLKNPQAFDQVAAWAGAFKGIIATGNTGTAKSRAAWSAIGRLYVKEGRTFAWFPVKRLITEFVRYESKDAADEFFRQYSKFNALFVDDLDKFNASFESEGAALFSFYDWAYRNHIAVLTTTNKPRAWWANLMGDPFARRLFDDAHSEVQF